MLWPSVAFLRRAALASVAAIVAIAYQAGSSASDPASPVIHAPIQVHHKDDGTVARGLRNEVQTSNWSGYAIAKYQTGHAYTSAYATWKVPDVSFYSGDTSGLTTQYAATWVGIGGFCQNALCTRVDRTLIQLGTEQEVSSDGTLNYYSWYELIPQSMSPMSAAMYPVHPNDVIAAWLACKSACSSKKQNWQLTMVNTTAGWSWTKNVTYSSSLQSAEWIAEAPSSVGGVLPLANFGTANLTPGINLVFNSSGVAGFDAPSLTVGANGIQMVDPWGETANPSATGPSGAPHPSFNDCWGGSSFTTCDPPT